MAFHFDVSKLQKKVTHIYGDVRDLDGLLNTFGQYQPQFVFHLAAQPLVRLSYDEPKMTFDTNVGGTVNVLEYSASKGCSELVFNAYLRSFFFEKASQNRLIGAASARAGNVIGGGDWGRDRLVPDCIRALSSGQTIGIRSPHAARPWQHVLEPLSGYLWLGPFSGKIQENTPVPGTSDPMTAAN